MRTIDIVHLLFVTHAVTYIGKGGYWEGRVDGAEGWFPRLAIKEINEEPFDYQPTNSKLSTGLLLTGQWVEPDLPYGYKYLR